MLTTLKDKKDKTTLFLYNGKIWQQQEHIFQFNFYDEICDQKLMMAFLFFTFFNERVIVKVGALEL